MTKNLWIIVICLSIMGSVGVYADVFLSLEAYNRAPNHFIEHEANQEAVDWLVYGEFPFWFLFSIITFPLCILFFVHIYEKHKDIEHANLYFASVIFFVYFLFWTRLFAGLTWFSSTWYICRFFQMITIGLFGGLCIYVFLYFPKQANTFPFGIGDWTNETN